MDDIIRATARLEPLTIEISHRRSPDQDAETLTIALTARPNFAAATQTLKTDTLLAMPWMIPVAGWMQLAGLAWRPWLSLMAPAAAATPWTQAGRAGRDRGNDIEDVAYRDIGTK